MSLRTSRDRRSGYATFGMNSKPNAGLICETATSWKGLQLGSDGTLAKVEVAA